MILKKTLYLLTYNRYTLKSDAPDTSSQYQITRPHSNHAILVTKILLSKKAVEATTALLYEALKVEDEIEFQ